MFYLIRSMFILWDLPWRPSCSMWWRGGRWKWHPTLAVKEWVECDVSFGSFLPWRWSNSRVLLTLFLVIKKSKIGDLKLAGLFVSRLEIELKWGRRGGSTTSVVWDQWCLLVVMGVRDFSWKLIADHWGSSLDFLLLVISTGL